MAAKVTLTTVFAALAAGNQPAALFDGNFTDVTDAIADQNTFSNYMVDTGSANAIAVAPGAGLTGTLAAGLMIQVNPAANNTGATTIAFNGGATKNLYRANAALVGGEIRANVPFQAIYDGTQWQLLTQGMQYVTNTLSGDVTLTTQNTYYDGPSCAQGTAGVWLAMGSVTVQASGSGADALDVKLWDGTSVKASGKYDAPAAVKNGVVSLSGVFVAPAGNIKISVTNQSNNGGTIKFNASGNSADATLTVIRLG